MNKYIISFICFLLTVFPTTQCSAEHIVGFLLPSSGLGDQSFNDMTYAGLIQARTRHNFTLIREQCTDFTEISRQEALERLLAKDADIIVANGWEYHELIKIYAGKYPQLIFIINDFSIDNIDNIASTIFGQHEGSFLAGALAGWMSQSGKIGFIGGMDIPVIRAFQSGFEDGAKMANPNIQISKTFLATPQDANSGFDRPELGFMTANAMYTAGVDIIFGAAGLSGNGIIQAARNQQKFAIGVDADQDYMAEGYVLTSVIKRLDKATFVLLDKIFRGEKIHGVYSFGLKEGGVSLSPMTYTKKLIPEEVLKKLEQLKQRIIDGDIIVANPLEDPPSPSQAKKVQ